MPSANNKKIGVMVTIQDSRQRFYAQFASAADLQTSINEKIESQFKLIEFLQPTICGIGPSALESTEFFVYYAVVSFIILTIRLQIF